MRFAALLVGAVFVWALGAVLAAPSDDPFLWLEQDSERAREWIGAQNDYTLKVLTKDDDYEDTLAEAQGILDAPDRIPYGDIGGGQVFNFWQDRAHRRGVWRRTTLAAYQQQNTQWELLLDLDHLAETQNQNWVWKGASCLPPAFLHCLVKLSRGGDAVVVREFDVPTRSFMPEGFEIAEAKSDVAWVDMNTVMVATNWGAGTLTRAGYPRIVKLWRRNQQLRDAQTVYEGDPNDVAIVSRTILTADGRMERFVVRGISTFGQELFHIDATGRVTRIAVPTSAEFKGLHRGQLIFLLRNDWPTAGRTFVKGSVVAFDLPAYLASGGAVPAIKSLFTPEAKTVAVNVTTSKDAVYLALLQNVRSRIHEVNYEGGQWLWRRVPLPEDGTIDVVAATDADDQVMLRYASFLTPDTLYLMQRGGAPREIRELGARFDAYGFEVRQFEATSADGTRVPYFLVRKEDTLNNGETPTIIYAYGGFQIPTTPWYWSTAGKLWLEKGGAYVVANVRGGGEFGPRWHEAARGLNRQKNFDDFAAVARDVIARGISSPRHLGAMGASQGGLLVTTTALQNPTLFNAVFAQVPLTDMLRYTQLSAGASWTGEYGNPMDPQMRGAILKWSPYQNIQAGTKYPKFFFLGSSKDDRVHPAHARKMAAKMQANGHPYFFYESNTGHDTTTTQRQRAEQLALGFTYFRMQLMD